jgi:hypothetical protein
MEIKGDRTWHMWLAKTRVVRFAGGIALKSSSRSKEASARLNAPRNMARPSPCVTASEAAAAQEPKASASSLPLRASSRS